MDEAITAGTETTLPAALAEPTQPVRANRMMSDWSGRRKPFVIGSAALMALAAVILAAAPTWDTAPALLTQVLPAAADRART